jgi:hypothetical protein
MEGARRRLSDAGLPPAAGGALICNCRCGGGFCSHSPKSLKPSLPTPHPHLQLESNAAHFRRLKTAFDAGAPPPPVPPAVPDSVVFEDGLDSPVADDALTGIDGCVAPGTSDGAEDSATVAGSVTLDPGSVSLSLPTAATGSGPADKGDAGTSAVKAAVPVGAPAHLSETSSVG